MFLKQLQARNPQLIAAALKLHREGKIQPDTYVLDLDTILANGRLIKAAADQYGLKLYLMTKQLGRNPLVAASLMKENFAGLVAVDYREALTLAAAGLKLGHVGHLVQVPTFLVPRVVACRPEYMTLYSLAKAVEVDNAARSQGLVQKILLRVLGPQDVLYPGQYGGFSLSELESWLPKLQRLKNLQVAGVTSFPCLLFNESSRRAELTPNVQTLQQAAVLLRQAGLTVEQINMPSVTCAGTMAMLAQAGATHGEPGHGLTGTTPLHAVSGQPERPALVYVSEISHNLNGRAYCYGGGYYRRSHMTGALVGSSYDRLRYVPALTPSLESIDYHLELAEACDVGDTCIFSFRTQIFVTRSQVAVVRGIQQDRPEILGIYDSQGRRLS